MLTQRIHFVDMDACVCVLARVCVHACLRACVRVSLYVWVWVRACVRVFVCVAISMVTYSGMHGWHDKHEAGTEYFFDAGCTQGH